MKVRERARFSGVIRFRRECPKQWAQVAQLVEHVTENHGVGGSIPSLGTILALERREHSDHSAAVATIRSSS